jgi:uncharacterized protein YbjQ (UPF0145 family)
MHPTTNTPIERFAFATAFFLSISFPLLVIGLYLATFLDISIGGMDAFDLSMTASIVTVVSGFGISIFCIFCAVKIEHDHIKALAEAEAELSDIVVSDMKTLPSNWTATGTVFITENVVLGNDYFKALRWHLRKFVGGESTSYSRLLSRARREATVRVLRKAKEYGANVVWNIRYETSVIYSNTAKGGKSTFPGMEVLAYATAFTVKTE